jgi:hypothetical protein
MFRSFERGSGKPALSAENGAEVAITQASDAVGDRRETAHSKSPMAHPAENEAVITHPRAGVDRPPSPAERGEPNLSALASRLKLICISALQQ